MIAVVYSSSNCRSKVLQRCIGHEGVTSDPKFLSDLLSIETQEDIIMSFLKGLLVVGLMALPLSAARAETKDIVDVAAGAGTFNTLVTAVKAAGLVDTLKGKGPFTVFAPTDAAFAKLPKGTVEDLLKPENKAKLVKILTYHVLPAKVMAADINGKKTNAKSVEGGDVMVDATDGVKVNEGKVVSADVAASNGVIHAIDTVLMPKM